MKLLALEVRSDSFAFRSGAYASDFGSPGYRASLQAVACIGFADLGAALMLAARGENQHRRMVRHRYSRLTCVCCI